jgi:diguanylate cyclase (GGDEF)-like protein
VRASDVVARLGGDEFAVFLRGIADEQIASRICASMLSGVAAIREAGWHAGRGCLQHRRDVFAAPIAPAIDVDRVLSCADEAMFQAKRDGKGRFHLCVAAL